MKAAPDPNRRLLIEGHADPSGDEAFNESLSQRRAGEVALRLVNGGGVPLGKTVVVGRGSNAPIVAADAPPEQQRFNRRVEVTVLCDEGTP